MKYTVVKAVQLPTGTLVKFNEDQAARRAGQLAHVKGKQYECLCPVWVKAGEVIDVDEVAKHVLASLQAPSGKPAAAEKVFVPQAVPHLPVILGDGALAESLETAINASSGRTAD